MLFLKGSRGEDPATPHWFLYSQSHVLVFLNNSFAKCKDTLSQIFFCKCHHILLTICLLLNSYLWHKPSQKTLVCMRLGRLWNVCLRNVTPYFHFSYRIRFSFFPSVIIHCSPDFNRIVVLKSMSFLGYTGKSKVTLRKVMSGRFWRECWSGDCKVKHPIDKQLINAVCWPTPIRTSLSNRVFAVY